MGTAPAARPGFSPAAPESARKTRRDIVSCRTPKLYHAATSPEPRAASPGTNLAWGSVTSFRDFWTENSLRPTLQSGREDMRIAHLWAAAGALSWLEARGSLALSLSFPWRLCQRC